MQKNKLRVLLFLWIVVVLAILNSKIQNIYSLERRHVVWNYNMPTISIPNADHEPSQPSASRCADLPTFQVNRTWIDDTFKMTALSDVRSAVIRPTIKHLDDSTGESIYEYPPFARWSNVYQQLAKKNASSPVYPSTTLITVLHHHDFLHTGADRLHMAPLCSFFVSLLNYNDDYNNSTSPHEEGGWH